MSYRWGKTPKKPHPGNLSRPEIEPGLAAWQASMLSPGPQRWTKQISNDSSLNTIVLKLLQQCIYTSMYRVTAPWPEVELKRPLDGHHCAIILMLPLEGQYYCTILRTKTQQKIQHGNLVNYNWYIAQYYPQTKQYYQVAQYISKSFNAINNIAQSFNLTSLNKLYL